MNLERREEESKENGGRMGEWFEDASERIGERENTGVK